MIPFSYTIEASIGSFYDHETMKDIPFSAKLWLQMGVKIGTALSRYAELILESDKCKKESERVKVSRK